MRLLRYLWALPNTVIGLAFVPVGLMARGEVRRVDGVIEVHGRTIAWLLRRGLRRSGGIRAMTLGHVVLGADAVALARFRRHEHVHVRQYERYGPFFLPLYGLASLGAWMRGQDPYRDNRFEREAYAEAP